MIFKNTVFENLLPIFLRIRALSLIILLGSNLLFAAGTLDQTFGTGGIANFRFGGTNSAAGAALQPDGKIVVVGITAPSGQSAGFNDISLARLNADGTLDTAFGANGFVLTDFNNDQDGAGAIVILPDGKILIGGSRRTHLPNSFAFAMARYNPDGSLDAAFGTGGKVVTDFPESLIEGISYLIPQADGKFLAAGSLYLGNVPNPVQIALVRYNANGSIDTTYGNGGILKLFLETPNTNINGFAIQPDGKILVSASFSFQIPGCIPTKGNSCTASQFFLTRYHPNMTLDRKFGRRLGKEFLRQTFGIYPQADGTFLLGGFPRVIRYYYNGRLDTIFDYAAFPNQSTKVQNGPGGLVVRPNGTIVGCRQLNGGNGYDDIGLVLFTPGGQVIGYEQRNFFNANDYCSQILIQPDGKILVIGSAQIQQQGSYSIAVLRYLDIVP